MRMVVVVGGGGSYYFKDEELDDSWKQMKTEISVQNGNCRKVE